MTIDYLLCTINGKPMESFIPGKKPTIQNTSNWILEEKQKEEHNKFVLDIIKELKL